MRITVTKHGRLEVQIGAFLASRHKSFNADETAHVPKGYVRSRHGNKSPTPPHPAVNRTPEDPKTIFLLGLVHMYLQKEFSQQRGCCHISTFPKVIYASVSRKINFSYAHLLSE
jgi:hypothetical protein